MKNLHNISEVITDTKVIVGTLVTVLGIAVWVALAWANLVHRVDAIEETQADKAAQLQEISAQINELKEQNGVIIERVDSVNTGLVETKSLILQLYNKLIR